MDIMAKRLRALREKMRMSQAKLAKEIGVTQASVNRYETARVTPPAEFCCSTLTDLTCHLITSTVAPRSRRVNSTIISRSPLWIQTKCASLLRCALTRNPP